MPPSQLIDRLTTLRTAIRVRLVAYGVCTVLAVAVAGFLVIAALDWLVCLPPLLRVAVAGMAIAGLVGATFRWVHRPLQARLGIDEIAARLEAHFGTFQDRLLSTVNFMEHRDASSEGMTQQVIANTEQVIRDIPLESALSSRPLMLRSAMLVLSVTVLATVLLVSPGWARVGLYRYIHPWGEIEWPRNVSILPLTGDRTVAVGESVTVRMAVQRGLRNALRGVVHLREPDGGITTLAMQRDQDNTFYATIDAVTTDLAYWFEAGDDNTGRSPYGIRVVRRPQVVEALAAVEPPPYASSQGTRVHDLGDGPVNAPIGGHVQVTLRASKPIPPDWTGTNVGLRPETGELIPLTVDPEDHHRLLSRFEIRGDLHFRAELRDAEGFENRAAARYSVLATPDTPPTVTIMEPRAVTELTPKGSVPLLIRVEDDFGIARLTLEAEHVGGSGSHTTPLTDRLRLAREDDGVQGIVRYPWSVASLSLSPGDLLIYRAEATDNRTSPEGEGQVGRSASMRIKIISDVEFDIRLRSDIALLEARIRQAALDQAELLDRTTALLRHADRPTTLTDTEREAVPTLSAQQARLVRRLRNLAARFHKLVERMKANHAGDEQARNRIVSSGRALEQIAAGPMTAASTALGEVREQVEARTQQETLGQAAQSQEAAVERLHALIRVISQWGSFHGLLTRTRDLLDRQDTLRHQTTELGKSMLGKPVESLTDQEAARLKRTKRQQGQLADDMEQLLARMKQLSATSGQKDQPGAQALDAALRAARAHETAKHMHTAVEAIEANRTAAATIAQKTAADGLRKMIAALRDRDNKELEELRKRLERAEDQVAHLLEQQQALRRATHEAGVVGADDATFDSFAQQQRTLKQNTRLLGQELALVERAAAAARPVRQAATPMGEAEAHLRENQAEPAKLAQDEAIALLEEALARLEQVARETAEEALWRSLEQIREDLEAILSAQRDVNTGIGKLKGAIEARGRIARLEARLASKLAREQAGVRAMVDAQVLDFQKVVVYQWALKRVGKWMDESRRRLSGRRIDDDLVAKTDRIVRELEKLVNAIVQTQLLPVDTEFVESDRGGGSGQGEMGQHKPVPTVAELLMLKAMQVDINERTGSLHESLDIDNATEEQLRELRMLGEDQAEVRRLTEMVTERVQHP
ncbi:MAG: hypothetical protein JSU86_10170 [Phycisphaerales bacterium]|nr:MAG: hypothetical protein JSU86_10170 [Phycisphaerales bacterium]